MLYLYQFFSIDATKTKGRLCQFANDAASRAPECNAVMKLKIFDGYPRLCLFSRRKIHEGEEIRYDYGEDESNLAWRIKVCVYNQNAGTYAFHFTCVNATFYQWFPLQKSHLNGTVCDNIYTAKYKLVYSTY